MKAHNPCHIGNTRLVVVRNPELVKAQRRTQARRRPSLVDMVTGWFRV